MTLSARVGGVAVWGPGLAGWAASRAVLAGVAPYVAVVTPIAAPALLPPAERRRAGPVIRLALAAATEAAAGHDAAALDAVFASSNGDGPVVGGILGALATGEARAVSPTQFHNSVHNAAAGYWSIGTGSRRPASAIGGHDESWAAGLLAALAGLRARGAPTLLCAYDHPLPPPLLAVRSTGPAFAAALVLLPEGAGPRLSVRFEPDRAPDPMPADDRFDELRANPAARSLPLLRLLAAGGAGTHHLALSGGRLVVELAP